MATNIPVLGGLPGLGKGTIEAHLIGCCGRRSHPLLGEIRYNCPPGNRKTIRVGYTVIKGRTTASATSSSSGLSCRRLLGGQHVKRPFRLYARAQDGQAEIERDGPIGRNLDGHGQHEARACVGKRERGVLRLPHRAVLPDELDSCHLGSGEVVGLNHKQTVEAYLKAAAFLELVEDHAPDAGLFEVCDPGRDWLNLRASKEGVDLHSGIFALPNF